MLPPPEVDGACHAAGRDSRESIRANKELRIGLVGFGQGFRKAFGPDLGGGRTERQNGRQTNAGCAAKKHARLEHACRHSANDSGTPHYVIPQHPGHPLPLTTLPIDLFRGRCRQTQTVAL